MKGWWGLAWVGFLLLLSSLAVVCYGGLGGAVSSGMIGLTAVAVAGVLLLLWFVPKLQVRGFGSVDADKRFNSENEARKSLAQIFGGIAFLATFYVSWANYNVEADKEVTETLGTAVAQLSNVEASVRIGGAYILERLSKSSPKDYDTIVAMLAQAVRDQSQKEGKGRTITDESLRPGESLKAPEDVEALMGMLGRRAQVSTGGDDRLNLENSDISGVRGRNLNFQWAYLVGSQMRAAYFYGIHLENAELNDVQAEVVRVRKAIPTPGTPDPCVDAKFNTHDLWPATLSCGHFNEAQLINGDFEGASFDRADLRGAQLIGGNFQRAQFSHANLFQADLRGADLRGANLQGAVGVTESQLNAAKTDACTIKPQFNADASDWKPENCAGPAVK
jgi:uncharacterized protein YjbI with pentapeptide repeats